MTKFDKLYNSLINEAETDEYSNLTDISLKDEKNYIRVNPASWKEKVLDEYPNAEFGKYRRFLTNKSTTSYIASVENKIVGELSGHWQHPENAVIYKAPILADTLTSIRKNDN